MTDYPPLEQTKHLCIQETTNEARLIEFYPEDIGLQETYGGLLIGWSPDGTRLAFTAREGAKMDVFILSIADGTMINLTEDLDGDYGFVVWLK